jgi:hypothetical protein
MKALAVISMLAVSSVAYAGPPTSFGAWMHYELSEQHAIDDAMTSSKDFILGGARVGGFVGGRRLMYAGSFDFAFGSTIGKSGFMYELGLLPLGIAVRPTERSLIVLASGIAGTGAIGTLDDAVALPLELTAETTLGPLRLLGRARASWLAASDARQDGAPSFAWTDEFDATLAIRVGHRFNEYELASGNGYFVGATYREMEGARFVGIVIGHSVDMGSEKRSHYASYGCDDCD